MGKKLLPAFGLGLLIILASPVPAAAHPDIDQAKSFLKQHLKDLQRKYPFSEWEEDLARCRRDLDKVRDKFIRSQGGFDRDLYKQLTETGKYLEALEAHRADVDKLSNELYVAVMLTRVEEKFRASGKTFDPAAKRDFQNTLAPYEVGSLRPKTQFLTELFSATRTFREIQSECLFSYAQDFLSGRVEEHLRTFNLAQNDALYDDFSLQLEYWSKEIQGNPDQANEQFLAISRKFEEKRVGLKTNLESLLEVLNTDMLFSDLLERARKDKVDFTLPVEEKIEASLKERNQATLAPINQRIAAWKSFAAALRGKLASSQGVAVNQKQRIQDQQEEKQRERLRTREEERRQQAKAREQEKKDRSQAQAEALAETQRLRAQAEEERRSRIAREEEERLAMENQRRENERMEALHAEQKRLEKEQKEKFKQTLSALKTFTFKSESSVELDADSKKALSTKAGFLKTSYVRSGQIKLKVDKAKFSDTLAFVQKFSVKDQQVDFSKMSLSERSSQSAYTYPSPAGRTSKGDLENFIAEVSLGSFTTYYNFLSYLAPPKWGPGKAVSWIADRDPGKQHKDREFSYVDLVVDAHRKRSGGPDGKNRVGSVNLPANMIVIFNPKGSIIRYQIFSDVGQVSIRPGDLVEGKLYYKFLNYSADRRNIYLNGIDPELKISQPG